MYFFNNFLSIALAYWTISPSITLLSSTQESRQIVLVVDYENENAAW